jgi:hypothetical protein
LAAAEIAAAIAAAAAVAAAEASAGNQIIIGEGALRFLLYNFVQRKGKHGNYNI